MQTLDLTPTWAGLMPALIACLQNGTGEGPAMAREELLRLAASVDSSNAAARSGGQSEDATRGLAAAMKEERAFAARDLARMASDCHVTGAIARAACYWEAAAIVAPAGMEDAGDWRNSADMAERQAAALKSDSFALARKEERADIAAALAAAALGAQAGGNHARAAGLYAAAALACPESVFSVAWGQEGRACEKAGQEGRAAAVKAAFAEGRREARDKARDAARESYDLARSCLGAYPAADLDRQKSGAAWRDTARDLRDALDSLVAALPTAIGEF